MKKNKKNNSYFSGLCFTIFQHSTIRQLLRLKLPRSKSDLSEGAQNVDSCWKGAENELLIKDKIDSKVFPVLNQYPTLFLIASCAIP